MAARRAARGIHVLRRERPRVRGALDPAADAHLRVDDPRRVDGPRGVHGRPRRGKLPPRGLGGSTPGPGPAHVRSPRDRDRNPRARGPGAPEGGRSGLPRGRARPRTRAHGLLRRAVRPGGPRARPAVRPDGRHAADSGPLARGPRGRDRRARRRALCREHARRGDRDGLGDVLPAPPPGCARGGARCRRHQLRRGARCPGDGPEGEDRGRADPGLRGRRGIFRSRPRLRTALRVCSSRPGSRGSPAWSTRWPGRGWSRSSSEAPSTRSG